MFDFDKAFKDAESDLNNKKLFLVLLGSSGNGKSTAQGTFGCKTLYLYTQGENHGPQAARTFGKDNVVPVCIDRDGEKMLSADESIKRLHSILDDVEALKNEGFEAISVDGFSELEDLVRNTTKFKIMTTTDSGKHNGFAEAGATLFQLKEIVSKLKKLHRMLKIHVCATEILTVKELGEDGTILDSAPQMLGYSVATGILQMFPDVLIIGRMQKKDKVSYRFQMLASSNKTSKDGVTQEVKKTFNFSPRITGIDILSLPSTLDANLAELAKLKEGSK